jgi:hypothetical protein
MTVLNLGHLAGVVFQNTPLVAPKYRSATACNLSNPAPIRTHAHGNSEWGITTFLALRVPLRIAAGTIGILNVRCNRGAE